MGYRDARSTACKLAFASQSVTSWQRDKKPALQDNSAMSVNNVHFNWLPFSLPLFFGGGVDMVLMKEGSGVLEHVLTQVLSHCRRAIYGPSVWSSTCDVRAVCGYYHWSTCPLRITDRSHQRPSVPALCIPSFSACWACLRRPGPG